MRSLLQPGRWIERAFGARAVILLYHRVAEPGVDPWSLAVSPRHFAEQMEVVRRSYWPLSLAALHAALRRGHVPEGAVVVTFDDGYADNLHQARPLLERKEVPATVFLTSGAIGSTREFWWDELERILLQPGTLPERLQLEIEGAAHEWELGEAAEYTPEAGERHHGWEARSRPPTARHRLYIALCDLLRRVPFGERRHVLDRLLAWAGMTREGRATHRALTAEEARALGEDGLVELGAHTVTHPALTTRPLAEQREEIQGSKEELEAILGRPVRSFAYPFGGSSTYTRETVDLVREAGFDCACTTTPRTVRGSTDLYQLPRIYAYDWDGEQFAQQLSRHLRARVG